MYGMDLVHGQTLNPQICMCRLSEMLHCHFLIELKLVQSGKTRLSQIQFYLKSHTAT